MSSDTRQAGQSLPFTATKAVRAAIARLGRCEDVKYSPDGRRLAIVGLNTNRLLIIHVETDMEAEPPRIALSGFLELESATFSQPHGIAWASDEILFVGNRRGNIAIVALPKDAQVDSSVEITPLRMIGGDGKDLITTPGSLSARPVGMGLIELLVCNNYVDHVTRHLIDRRDGYKVLASDILIDDGLAVPDGIARTASGQWIAVSNHEHHNVLLFRHDKELNGASKPDGILTGLSYPHGLKFAADGRTLLVADAGAPFVTIFKSEDGDWSGERAPSEAIQAIGDTLFRHGHYSAAEGGPKGIDLTSNDRVMVTSCERQPLAFFDMRNILPVADPSPLPVGEEAESARAIMALYLSSGRDRALQESEAIRRASDFDRRALIHRELEIKGFLTSRSWRLTAPLRRLYARYQMMTRRP